MSRTRLARLISDGCVRVNAQVVVDPRARIGEGDEISIALPEVRDSHIIAQSIPIEIVYEDADLVVVNKPAGMVVHPAPGSPDGTLVNALLGHFGGELARVGDVGRPGIVHRIDKDTSGLLVVAKSDRAHLGLSQQFAKHTVERLYTALAFGVPDAAEPRLRGIRGLSFEDGGILKITTGLGRHRTDRQKQAVTFNGGRHAVTRMRVDQSYGTPPCLALVECWLETGRTHQIRVHMAHIGHGLVGDPIYGGRRKLPKTALSEAAAQAVVGFNRQALHAGTLGFVHPINGEAMTFSAALPDDFQKVLDTLP